MERTALAGIRQCLRTSNAKTLRCKTQSQKCIAKAICPARHAAGISMSASSSPSNASIQRKTRPTTILRTRHQPYSSSSSSSPSSKSATSSTEAAQFYEPLEPPTHLDTAEKDIFDVLVKGLEPSRLEVKDVSGGCGSMYSIEIESERFRGLGMLKQQRLVNGVLGERVKGWHGVQMKTGVP